jgi:hypothetical protein
MLRIVGDVNTRPSSSTLYSRLLNIESESESESYVRTDGQSASLSWNEAPIWGLRPDIYYSLTLMVLFCGAPSLTRRRVCLLYMLLVLASADRLGSESLCSRDHVLLSQIWDFPFRRLLRFAGSRWRYWTPPAHEWTFLLLAPFHFMLHLFLRKGTVIFTCHFLSSSVLWHFRFVRILCSCRSWSDVPSDILKSVGVIYVLSWADIYQKLCEFTFLHVLKVILLQVEINSALLAISSVLSWTCVAQNKEHIRLQVYFVRTI